MLQVRENEISLHKWSCCSAQLRILEGTLLDSWPCRTEDLWNETCGLPSVQPRAQRWWVGARKRFIGGVATGSPPVQHSIGSVVAWPSGDWHPQATRDNYESKSKYNNETDHKNDMAYIYQNKAHAAACDFFLRSFPQKRKSSRGEMSIVLLPSVSPSTVQSL